MVTTPEEKMNKMRKIVSEAMALEVRGKKCPVCGASRTLTTEEQTKLTTLKAKLQKIEVELDK